MIVIWNLLTFNFRHSLLFIGTTIFNNSVKSSVKVYNFSTKATNEKPRFLEKFVDRKQESYIGWYRVDKSKKNYGKFSMKIDELEAVRRISFKHINLMTFWREMYWKWAAKASSFQNFQIFFIGGDPIKLYRILIHPNISDSNQKLFQTF